MEESDNPHLGEYIKAGLKKNGITISHLAKSLGLSRAAVYDMLKRRSLHLNRINELSDILPDGFFDDYIDRGLLFLDHRGQTVNEPSSKYGQNVVRIQLTLDIGAVNEDELAEKVARIKRAIQDN